MPLPRRLARFNRVVTNRVFGPLAGRIPPWVLVEHIGRRSGRRYRAVLSAFRHPHPHAAALVLPLTYGEESDWPRNIETAQWCRVKYAHRWRTFESAELVRGEAALRLLPPLPRAILRLGGMRTAVVVRPGRTIG